MNQIFNGILFFVLVVLLPAQILAQSKPAQRKKTSFSLSYMPALTKTAFEKSMDHYFEHNSSLIFRDLFQIQKPNKPVNGYLLRGTLERQIYESFSIGLSLGFSSRGQESPLFFAIDGRVPEEYPKNYGGISYKLEYKTTQLGITWKKQFRQRAFIFPQLRGLIGIEVFNELELKDFILDKSLGISTYGCCTSTFSFGADQILFRKIGNGYFSPFFEIGLDLDISTFPWLSVGIGPYAGMAFEIYEKDNSFPVVFYGNSYWLGCQFSLKSSF